jgi:hypothetical protein
LAVPAVIRQDVAVEFLEMGSVIDRMQRAFFESPEHGIF